MNILGLAFIGTIFEERIGPRPFILLYLLAGFVGTLTFAAAHWNDQYVAVVGASGAIFGVMGAFARLYPNERMVLLLFPFAPMPIWVIVGIFVLIQFVFVSGEANVAVEAHLGGLLAGILLAPIIVKAPLHKRVKRMVSLSALKKLATTPELKAMMRRIEEEEIPDVRSAWIEHFLASARCPHCGSRLKVSKETVRCEKGHLI
jgi:membrane associated rhomboid family serine protease